MTISKSRKDEMRMKLAVALAMWKTSIRSNPGAEENQWRRKAEVLEEKYIVVTKQLEELQGAVVLDRLPLLAPCKCHFLKSAGNEQNEGRNSYGDYIRQSAVQIFLRNVRVLRKLKLQSVDDNSDEMQGNLAIVIDFVIELLSCQAKSIHLKGRYSEAYIHHAVDFIKDTIPLLRREQCEESQLLVVNNLVKKLALDLVGNLLNFTPSCQDDSQGDDQEETLVVMLRLAEYAYIGHRMLLTSSQQMTMVLERLQCTDPFDEGFSQAYENLFYVIQLIETLVSAHLKSWKDGNNIEQEILEEWVTSHFHCKSTLEGRPNAWTSQIMIMLDSITEKLLEQLQPSAELDAHDGLDIWQKALVHLLASTSSTIREIQQL
ncbi:protein MULTIPOLAR SPINDLE 1 isoform X2 [Physcomitrium patens]|uniref:Uncharacterized protein n=1 Tax=Physcomitrium patens TaxID=3218 RepID=A0A2K1KAP8_PHYPA|nr:protein MULTIPOLAR SPINDLE 1-like isoform X2 [Physcomitrium patens]PNR50854.1 hypothetical protein PHYPA_010040 [Physcomitrium patens]|eukprot:XP_024379946.1 protein MULTIPOLAR SPINDLE 1-like isoform X2 [Physcomitrella patens]